METGAHNFCFRVLASKLTLAKRIAGASCIERECVKPASALKSLLMNTRIAVLLVFLALGSSAFANSARTNVIVVLVDNQGYFELGCKGNPFLKTPNIDQFAKRGVDFCNFHAENFCSPSRAALLTGKQPMRMGVHNTVGGVSLLDPQEVTLADRLKDAGYRTGVFGKWHLGMSHPFHPSFRGFDEVFVHGGGGIGQLEDYAGNRHMNAHFQHNGEWEESFGFSSDVLFDRAMEFIESSV
ncbi:MAG: sulfatase-like hydrolase/transferase, partial [Planctomycetota bacterium]